MRVCVCICVCVCVCELRALDRPKINIVLCFLKRNENKGLFFKPTLSAQTEFSAVVIGFCLGRVGPQYVVCVSAFI
jgi:hypothetical protein